MSAKATSGPTRRLSLESRTKLAILDRGLFPDSDIGTQNGILDPRTGVSMCTLVCSLFLDRDKVPQDASGEFGASTNVAMSSHNAFLDARLVSNFGTLAQKAVWGDLSRGGDCGSGTRDVFWSCRDWSGWWLYIQGGSDVFDNTAVQLPVARERVGTDQVSRLGG